MSAERRDVLVVYGTRPEAIKLAPVIKALHRSPVLRPVVAVTGQHRAILDQVDELFGIRPDLDLEVFAHGQPLGALTTKVLDGVGRVLEHLRPAAVVVQGDTTSTFAAALAAFYARVPVAHVEAGLRTGDLDHPFPEEANRCLTSRIAALHLAPTEAARANLLAEGIAATSVVTTGNTVIDALLDVVGRRLPVSAEIAEVLDDPRRVVLVTAHRRESWGQPMADIGTALAELARRPDVLIVLPAHPNPVVRADVLPKLIGRENVRIVEPLGYGDFARLLQRADLALSDSGGLQEEAPSVGTPVLILRETTERIEAVQAGTAKLVGTDPATIVAEAARLLDDPRAYAAMARVANPFGDGRASERVVAAVAALLGVGTRLPEFAARSPARALVSAGNGARASESRSEGAG